MKSFSSSITAAGTVSRNSPYLEDQTAGIDLIVNGSPKTNFFTKLGKQLESNMKDAINYKNLLWSATKGAQDAVNNRENVNPGPVSGFERYASELFRETSGITLDNNTKKQLLQQVNITGNPYKITQYYKLETKDRITGSGDGKVEYENPFKFPSKVIDNLNNYQFIFKDSAAQAAKLARADKGEGENQESTIYEPQTHTAASPSLFNQYNAVPAQQLTPHVPNIFVQKDNMSTQVTMSFENPPLGKDGKPQQRAVQWQGVEEGKQIKVSLGYKNFAEDLGNCSIKELVKLSRNFSGLIGGSYRYADFMYCKDLGKVSNNHLITLRKFAVPVGDIINIKTRKGVSREELEELEAVPSSGTLVSWFGTGENNLEDILKYDMEATWRPLEAKWDQQESKAESNPGMMAGLMNNLNPGYNRMQASGYAGANSVIRSLGSKITIPFTGGKNLGAANPYDYSTLRNYDKNKVYEPKDRIWDTHIYEGKLKFSNEFTLKFSYTIRAYDNINPKSAMLDLIGNILEVCYRKGSFWRGKNQVIGPPENTAGYKKMNHMIDEAWDKLGGFLDALFNGNIDFKSILGSISEIVSNAAGAAADFAKEAIRTKGKSVGEAISNIYNNVSDWAKSKGITDAMKGQLKNSLGRPSLYTFDSLLSGGNVGLWHLTLGNPKNPIAVMGNLIMTKATVTHSGPLGIDDFPTNITVTVTLKHARGRDATDISKMYTKGYGGIYMSLASKKMSKYFKSYNNNLETAQEALDIKTSKSDDAKMAQAKAMADEAKKSAEKADSDKQKGSQSGDKPAASTPANAKQDKDKNAKQEPTEEEKKAAAQKAEEAGKNKGREISWAVNDEDATQISNDIDASNNNDMTMIDISRGIFDENEDYDSHPENPEFYFGCDAFKYGQIREQVG